MGKLDVAKDFLNKVVEKAPVYLKKYSPHLLVGTGGIGIGIAICQPGKKKAEENGYKKGYAEASAIYEKKFRLQTEEFLAKGKSIRQNKEEFDELIEGYEKEIAKLQDKVKKSEEEKAELKVLIGKKKELLQLEKAC